MKKFLLFLFFSQLYFAQQYSISFAERTALVNLYLATSGEEWSQKWDFEKDPKYWYGVKIKNGSVTEINLRGNALKGNFPPSVSGFSKLQKLDLSSNQLMGEVAPALSSLNNLVRLDISNNRLSGDPAAVIIPLFNLKEISVGNNNFAFADLNTFLQNFPTLQVLDLSQLGLTAVPSNISTLTSLESLNISNNTISQNFGALSALANLKELNFSGNQLTQIPSQLSSLTGLTSLDLSRNLFATNYSAALASLKNLEWLSLADNQITAFPTELSQLKKLVHFNISDNKISGGFGSLLVLKDLEQLYLDKNLISGIFPAELLQLSQLQMISLTGNQLSGEIPNNIPALTFLENNRYTRQDIKNFISKDKILADFTYSPQRYDEEKTVFAALGTSATLPQSLSGEDYQFTWFKNLDQKTAVTAESYYISKVEDDDFTDYTCEAYTFEKLPEALLEISFFREPVTLGKDLGTAEVKTDLVVYPNPATDFIHIKTIRQHIEKVFIFDLSGKLILTDDKKDINISHLPAANYIISIKTDEGIKSFKMIKK
ncbi:leucine-rich repeat domain-containing protein [Kaistella sp. 97-N-M2]|uniref:leucine-rich repeat domain-containing protein n=1 Tax=Kaistella sp. 97-N-M2 TaxID=2908645 RepID=UPI001F361799|nr:leucine-rich repeat domain-containing protein [Kaistella sp. 97-N-M2]UJF30526.1 leucine-rich repeat domain-containing protein [Kaistella sp. 97-N-M2]